MMFMAGIGVCLNVARQSKGEQKLLNFFFLLFGTLILINCFIKLKFLINEFYFKFFINLFISIDFF